MKIVNFADGFSSVAPPAIDDYVSQAELDAHTSNTSNPHSTTKAQVGLSNVPDVDCTNPANIIQDATHRFVTDAEKTLWNAGGIQKDTYANLLTWVLTAINGAFAFSTDTKVMYYAVDGELQEVALMKTINGTITNAQITVGTSRVRATVSGSAPSSSRKRLAITPLVTNGAIYIGGSGVTTANGRPIIGPDTIYLDWDASDYYLISDNSTGSDSIVAITEVV